MGISMKNTAGRNNYILHRFRYAFLVAVVFVVSFLLFLTSNRSDFFDVNSNFIGYSWKPHHHNVEKSDEMFTIKTEGCTIPSLNPYDRSIKKYIERPKDIKPCHRSKTALIDNNSTHIWIVRYNLPYYDLPSDSNVSCCYKSFYRPVAIPDISSSDVDDRVKYNTCIEFYDAIKVKHEFIRVTCYFFKKVIYEQFFPFTPKKPFASFKEDSYEIAQNETAFNVILLGIDAISRLNFHRTMPKTVAFLKKKGAIELKGYNKVGDNTFPNLIPMLLGIREGDLKKTCWPNSRVTFDNCPFIWDWYKDAGYYTALGEDSASLGTFNFEKLGFGRTPTDYYLHTFTHEAELYSGNNRDFNSFICMGNKYFYKVLLDYIESLTLSLRSSKLFGFFWEVTMSHDYLNYPMAMDDNFETFFKNLDSLHYLDNTVFILLSDHGMRWGDIRFTKQGRLEERLPLIHILLPPTFQDKFSDAYENIKSNIQRLTTPFDVYTTLLDLANLFRISNEIIKIRSTTNYANDKGISLFLPIPSNRTCKMADIDDHWCTCHKGKKISTSSVEASNAAMFLIWHLNTLIKPHKECARLSLLETIEVTEMIAGTPSENEEGWREFLTVIRTVPGNGIFEATLRHDNQNWSVTGTISRLNLYGQQSRCMHNYQLKLYCYCK